MARLAEIKNAASKIAGQPTRTVYVNPLNVTYVEPLHNEATKIYLNDGQSLQTTLSVTDVVGIIQQSML